MQVRRKGMEWIYALFVPSSCAALASLLIPSGRQDYNSEKVICRGRLLSYIYTNTSRAHIRSGGPALLFVSPRVVSEQVSRRRGALAGDENENHGGLNEKGKIFKRGFGTVDELKHTAPLQTLLL